MAPSVFPSALWLLFLALIGIAQEVEIHHDNIRTVYGIEGTTITLKINTNNRCVLYHNDLESQPCETKIRETPKNCSQFNYATMVIMFGSCKVTFQNLSQSHEGLWKVGIDTYAQINAYFHLNVLDKQFANIARPEIPFEDCQLPHVGLYLGDLYSPQTESCDCPNISKCQEICRKNSRCLAWHSFTNSLNMFPNYTQQTQFCCYLKRRLELVYVHEGRYSGFGRCPSCIKDNTTIQNPLRTTVVEKYSSCQNECNFDPKCTHFAYVVPKIPQGNNWPFGIESECIMGGPQSQRIQAQERTLWQPKRCPNGEWSQWSNFSECSSWSYKSQQYRHRTCHLKDFSGPNCDGPWKEQRDCKNGAVQWIHYVANFFPQFPIALLSLKLLMFVTTCLMLFSLWDMLDKTFKSAAPTMQEMKLVPMENSKHDVQNSNSIPVSDFRDRVRKGVNPYPKEFNDMHNEDFWQHGAFSRSSGPLDRNHSQNRFPKILPYDHSMVRLQENLLGTHYINASFIHGIDDNLKVIATQGPTKETVAHFLQMLCENSVQFVIMLTNLEENNPSTGKTIENCVKYWPNMGSQPLQFEPFQVSTHSKKHIGIRLVQRQCAIRHKGQKHSFQQIQFEDWLDSNSPDHLVHGTTVISQLLPQTRKTTIVVHCSGGVGRTGLFLGLFKLMKDIDNRTPTLDVYGTVLAMRRDRNFMVQTEAQYKYLYLCTERYLRQKDGSDDHYESEYMLKHDYYT